MHRLGSNTINCSLKSYNAEPNQKIGSPGEKKNESTGSEMGEKAYFELEILQGTLRSVSCFVGGVWGGWTPH